MAVVVPQLAVALISLRLGVDEVLQIIFNEIDHPTSFVLVCRRFNALSRDPYVRAHYFLARYGAVQALYWALGRGKLITEQVLDVSGSFSWSSPPICVFYHRVQVLLNSGAHLSRYLVQIAAHHYFRSFCPFIKTPWVRTLSLATLSHFLKLSSEKFGTINTIKGEDDGSVFRHFIKESRMRADRRGLATDAIAEMLDKGKVSHPSEDFWFNINFRSSFPFAPRFVACYVLWDTAFTWQLQDPIMAQFPLALSIEPRLLPLAIANGFRMDNRVRGYYLALWDHPFNPAGPSTVTLCSAEFLNERMNIA